jgi:pyridoxine/pyridoxamine 5'-phosphate oxidase
MDTASCLKKIEFWQQRAFRHHDRRVLIRGGNSWLATWLFS